MATIAELKVKLGLDKRDYDKGMKDAEVTAKRTVSGLRVSALGFASAFTAVTAGLTIATGALGKFAQRGDKSLESMGIGTRNAGDAFTGLALTIDGVVDAAARRVAGSGTLVQWFDGLAGAIDAGAAATGRFVDKFDEFMDRRRTALQQADIETAAFFGLPTPGQMTGFTGPPTNIPGEAENNASIADGFDEAAFAAQNFQHKIEMLELSVPKFHIGAINPLTGALVDFGTEGQLLSSTFLPDLTGEINKSATATTVYKIAADAAKDSTDEWKLSLSGLTGALGGISGILSGFGIGVPFLGNIFSIASGTDLLSSIFGGGKNMAGKSIPGRAHGGPVGAGTAYMVGERGPEMFVPRQSGTIVPNGGVTINVPPARDPITFARDQQWQRAIAETFRELESGGFRAAGA